MDKRFLFPALAATLCAQTPAPVPDVVPRSRAEADLLARAQKFYQLEVEKKFRQAMLLVADDSQDYFFGASPNLQGFHINSVEIVDDSHAKVNFTGTVMMLAPGMVGRPFDTSGTSTWKMENGQWAWYVDQKEIDTPFGKIKPTSGTESAGVSDVMKKLSAGNALTPESLMEQVKIDRTSVELSSEAPQTVKITNGLPGPITVEVNADRVPGLTVTADRKNADAQQAVTLSFQAVAGKRPMGTVGIEVQPVGTHFDIVVTSK